MKVIVLAGPPLIGKTRLAHQMCNGKKYALYIGDGKIKGILKDCYGKKIDLLVIDDVSKNNLKKFEELIKEKLFQDNLTIILTTQFTPSWITEHKEVELWNEDKIKEMIS